MKVYRSLGSKILQQFSRNLKRPTGTAKEGNQEHPNKNSQQKQSTVQPQQQQQTSQQAQQSSPVPQQLFDQEFHIINQQKSLEKDYVSHDQLKFNGKIVNIFGMPIAQNRTEIKERNTKVLEEFCMETAKNEIALISIDPSYHISDKRALQLELRKRLLFNGQDIDQEESLKDNPTYPLGIEELRLDLLPLDFIKATETEKMLMVQKIQERSQEHRVEGYFTSIFSNQNEQQQSDDAATQELYSNKLNELQEIIIQRVIGNKNIDVIIHPQLIEATFFSLLGKKIPYLCHVPRIYQRTAMANNIELEYLKQMFKELLKFSKQNKIKSPDQFCNVSPLIFSHLYEYINDFYIYFTFQKACQTELCQTGVNLFLKQSQVEPMKLLFNHYGDKGFKQNEDFLEFLSMEENKQDNDEALLEKHAIIDVLFADNLWESPFVKNPFPYLQENYTQLKAQDKAHVSQIFASNVKKYKSVAREFLK